jgi:hypothetical protein
MKTQRSRHRPHAVATPLLIPIFILITFSLAPGQSGQLRVSNVRTTHGALGPIRPDNKILPGDLVCLSFDIEGFQANSAGKVLYGVGMEVADSKGDVLFKREPSQVELPNPASGKSVPACAKVDVGLNQPSGKYDVKITVADRNAGTATSAVRSYEVLPLEFGIVRVSLTDDREGKSSAAVFAPGRPGWINFTAVGFGRDNVKKQPHLTATMRVLDEGGRPVFPKPSSGAINEGVPAQVGAVPMQFQLVFAQPGRFTVELKATDEITGRKTTVSFPIQVVASK